MPTLLAFLAATADTTVALTGAQTVWLETPRIRLADVAAPAGLPRRAWDRLAGNVIATLSARDRFVTLSRKAVATLIARRVPGARALADPGAGPIRFEVKYQISPAPPLACRRLGTARHADEPVVEADLIPAPCTADRPAELRFDRAGRRLVAKRDLSAGSYVGRVVVPLAPAVKRGDGLRLISRVGPVTIERAVTAMQGGNAGLPVFVRDPDGNVFAVRTARMEAIR